jgi:hypothetical protein
VQARGFFPDQLAHGTSMADRRPDSDVDNSSFLNMSLLNMRR